MHAAAAGSSVGVSEDFISNKDYVHARLTIRQHLCLLYLYIL